MLYYSDGRLVKDENRILQIAAISVLGDRDDQQDSLGYVLRQDESLAIVCDGMGGHAGGKAASEIGVKTLLDAYEQSAPSVDRVNMLTDAAKKANESVLCLKDFEGNPLNAGSTLVAAFVRQKELVWCSVGDSRAYLIRKDEMVQLTQDHSYRTVLIEKVKTGLLSEAEFEKENAKGEALISYLGIGDLSLVDYSENPLILKHDDKILIVSDGLYKTVSDEETARIVSNFSNIGEAVQALELKARKNAKAKHIKRDNMTVILIKIK